MSLDLAASLLRWIVGGGQRREGNNVVCCLLVLLLQEVCSVRASWARLACAWLPGCLLSRWHASLASSDVFQRFLHFSFLARPGPVCQYPAMPHFPNS